MTCVIDTGGGLRGIFGAGFFDGCLERKINFDVCVGVSAGAANVASFTACQSGRNYSFYADYSLRPEYMSLRNYLMKGSYIDLDYVYGVLSDSDGENPLDYERMRRYDGKMYFVSTSAENGEPVYFGLGDISQDDYRVFGASSAIPAVCRPVEINGLKYFDGGVSDPVPVEFAKSLGCDRIILILTKPVDFRKNGSLERRAALLLEKKYPAVSDALLLSADRYNRGVEKALSMQKAGECVIIAPSDTCGADTLTRDRDKLDALYKMGREAAKNFV